MPDKSTKYAIIFDPEDGFQLLDTATDEVADLAVLEGTWRKRGESPAAGDTKGYMVLGEVVASANPSYVQKMTTVRYGALRLRSTGSHIYAIADPRVSLRDDQSEQP